MKSILITGGSSGIGLATAELFLKKNYQVIITGRNKQKLNTAQNRLRKYGSVESFVSDISYPNEILRLRDEMKKMKIYLDVIFANAGIGIFKPFIDLSQNDVHKLIDTNLKGTIITIQYLFPFIKPSGSIIINASWTQRRGVKNASVYGATKAAVSYLSRALSLEMANKNIRVNTISPGYTNTDQFNEEVLGKETAAAMIAQVPSGHFTKTKEIAKAVWYLAEEANYVNGEELVIDGGLTAVHNY